MEETDRPEPLSAGWLTLAPERPEEVPLRSWWARPQSGRLKGALLVLPEIFGVNPWVCAVANRWAQRGYGALALPLFARTAPELSLGYGPEQLQEGRSHKDRTSARTLLVDGARAVRWLQSQGATDQPLAVGCMGFCFGGHVALLACGLKGVAASCVCYGAGVVQGRPGGGPPSLEVLAQPGGGRVLFIYGREDPLVPAEDLEAIATAVDQANARGEGARAQLQTFAAGHGFLCEARDDFRPEQAQAAWAAITAFFDPTLAEKG